MLMVTFAAMPNATVDCGKHGTQPGAVGLRSSGRREGFRVVGFVENTLPEPDDLPSVVRRVRSNVRGAKAVR